MTTPHLNNKAKCFATSATNLPVSVLLEPPQHLSLLTRAWSNLSRVNLKLKTAFQVDFCLPLHGILSVPKI